MLLLSFYHPIWPYEPLTAIRNLQTITRAKLVKRADMFIRKYGEPLAFFFFNEELATMTESNKRRIYPAVVSWMGITSISMPTPCWRHGKPYYDAPSLLFPYRDRYGQLMNVQSRYLGRQEGIPRFRFPSHSECRIYGLPVVGRLQTGEGLWLSEGVTDCLALLSSGRKAIAIPGATLLKPEDVKLLANLRVEKKTVFHIFPDKDEAGERLYRQLLNAANEIGACLIRDELPEGCKDFGQWWASQV